MVTRDRRVVKLWLGLLALLWLAFLGAAVVFIVSRAKAQNGGLGGPLVCSFTEEQGDRGEDVYAAYCAACHGEELRGDVGPALVGQPFLNGWGDRPIQELFTYISNHMPQNEPGSLTTEAYTEVTAYLLVRNGFPPGGEPLLPGTECLENLTVGGAVQVVEIRSPQEEQTQQQERENQQQEAGEQPTSTTANGQQIYQNNCTQCHGGEGEGGVGPALAGNAQLEDTQHVVTQILHGGGGMPAFADQLSAEQIAAVASYIRTGWGNSFGDVTAQTVEEMSGQGGAQEQQGGSQQEAQQQEPQGMREQQQAQQGQPSPDQAQERVNIEVAVDTPQGVMVEDVTVDVRLRSDMGQQQVQQVLRPSQPSQTQPPQPSEQIQPQEGRVEQQGAQAQQVQQGQQEGEEQQQAQSSEQGQQEGQDEPQQEKQPTSTTANGQQIYQNNCTQCHGGEGEGGVGPALAGNAQLEDTQHVVTQILHGGGGMPAFADQLSAEQIAAVASYIRTGWGNAFGQVSTQRVRQIQGDQQPQQQNEQEPQETDSQSDPAEGDVEGTQTENRDTDRGEQPGGRRQQGQRPQEVSRAYTLLARADQALERGDQEQAQRNVEQALEAIQQLPEWQQELQELLAQLRKLPEDPQGAQQVVRRVLLAIGNRPTGGAALNGAQTGEAETGEAGTTQDQSQSSRAQADRPQGRLTISVDQRATVVVLGPDGYFHHLENMDEETLEGVAPGNYVVAAAQQGYQSTGVLVRLSGGETADVSLALEAIEGQ